MGFVTRSTDYEIPEWPKWVYRDDGKGIVVANQEEADEFLGVEVSEDAPKRRGRPPKD